MIPVKLIEGQFVKIEGNPVLFNEAGTEQAPLQTIQHPSWTEEERKAFGVYLVDVTPPEGKEWKGEIQNISGTPTPVFEDVQQYIPTVVSQRKARLTLLSLGHLATIESMIDSLAEPERTAAKIEWEYALEIKRSNPLVQSIVSSLGWSEEQLDQLFEAANQIPD